MIRKIQSRGDIPATTMALGFLVPTPEDEGVRNCRPPHLFEISVVATDPGKLKLRMHGSVITRQSPCDSPAKVPSTNQRQT